MAMNFFEHQERAHKKTKLLTFLFVLASVLMVLTISAMVGGLAYLSENQNNRGRRVQAITTQTFFSRYGDLMALAAAGTLAIIAFGSLTKTVSLRQGGGKVARDMGGVLLTPNEQDLKRRRLLNVVEEMAVASGVPVPEVYLLEQEPGINAFAAGFNQGDAAIGVTQGTLDRLNREELQGVIAHEFSHVFNGDMRLNMKLMGVLHGILLIGLMGQILLRSGMYSNMFRGRRSRNGGGAAMAMMAFGLGVYIVGSIGIFFGHLIKAAVSRQREFLADASAVQFTRNPEGIGNALKKIGGYAEGSRLQAAKTEEVSHLLFGSGMNFWFPGLSTHPPLVERIKAIDPNFDPREFEQFQNEAAGPGPEAAAGFAPGVGPSHFAVDGNRVMASVGNPGTAHLEHAGAVLGGIPADLRTAVQQPERVTALVFALLLNTEPGVRARQQQAIGEAWGEAVEHETVALQPVVQAQDRSRRLALVELALPALKRQSANTAERFLDTVDVLVKADSTIDLFEFALTRVLRTHLSDAYQPDRGQGALSVGDVSGEIHTVLTLLAIAGHDTPQQADPALRAGLRVLGLEPRSDTDLSDWVTQVDAALTRLDQLAPRNKEQFLRAVLAVITRDGRVTAEESDLLRAICQSLHVPLPSLAVSA